MPIKSIVVSVFKDHDIIPTHGDFDFRDIPVQADKVTLILDWEMSGYYPAYWEDSRPGCGLSGKVYRVGARLSKRF